MCLGPEVAGLAMKALPFVAQGVGTLLQHRAQEDAIRRQEEAALAEQVRQNRLQEEAAAAVNESLQQFEEKPRRQHQEVLERDLAEDYEFALERAEERGPQRVDTSVGGRVTEDYLSREADALSTNMARANYLAELLSAIDAGTYMRDQETYNVADSAANLGRIRGASRGSQFAAGVEGQQAGQVAGGPVLAGEFIKGAGLYGPSWLGSSTSTPSRGLSPQAQLFTRPFPTIRPIT